MILKYKDYYNYDLVVARLLFPNYYFDLFDRVILGDDSEDILYKVISKNRGYERYLRRIINCIGTFFDIKKIDWI